MLSPELRKLLVHGISVKIGTIQRRLAWPLHKDDTQISTRKSNLFFFFFLVQLVHNILDTDLKSNLFYFIFFFHLLLVRLVHNIFDDDIASINSKDNDDDADDDDD